MIISLWGWYGHHNYGDDLMLLNSIKMISDNISASQILLYGEDSMDFLNDFHVSVRKRNIRECLYGCIKSDAFIWNGGTGLPHKNNAKIIFLLLIALIMRIRRKKFILLGFGVGESTLNNTISCFLFKALICMSSLFTCRQVGINKYIRTDKFKNMFITGDMAFCSFESERSLYYNSKCSDAIGISLANVFEGADDEFKKDFFNQAVLIAKVLIDKGYKVCFISFAENDNILNEKIAHATNAKVLKYNDNPAKFHENILSMRLIIAMRFHAVAASLRLCIPVCCISYSEKGADLMEQFGLGKLTARFGANRSEYWGIKKNITSEEILSIVNVIENNYESIQTNIQKSLPKILEASYKNYLLLFQTLNNQI